MAKIVVIGTSNSVMGQKGFIKSLSIDHEVINLSSGRVPFYCHIKTIQKNKNLIESADLLIIDHYVNDMNCYALRLGHKYYQDCEYLYQLLSTINTNILNLLFPLKNLNRKKTFDYYERVKQLTQKYNLSILDLNDYEFQSYCYHDPAHLNHKTSYILGLSLSKVINIFQNDKPSGGKLLSTPFKIIDANSLAKLTPESELKTFKNSLLEVDYLDIKNELTIPNLQGMTLKSMGYIAPKDMVSKSALIINNKYPFSLISGGYFHDSFSKEIVITDKLTLTPIQGSYRNVPTMMHKDKISGKFDFLFITELLLFTESEMNYQPATRSVKSIVLKDLESILDSILADTKILTKLPSVITDQLKDVALLLENTNLEKSCELMKLVNQARPNNLFAQQKLEEYQKRLNPVLEEEQPQESATISV